MNPKIGTIVKYNATEEQMKAMRDSFKNTGKSCNEQAQLAAVIVGVWGPTCVNLKVFLDGEGELWVTSASQGNGPYNWNYIE